MKKVYVILILTLWLFASVSPLFAAETQQETNSAAVVSEAKGSSVDLSVDGMITGPGLLLVGGAGAGITVFNNHRRKENEPSREIKEGEKKRKRSKTI